MSDQAIGLDLTSGAFWQGNPYPTLRELRERRGIYRHETGTRAPFWVLTRYEDVSYVSKHPEVFSSAHGVSFIEHSDDAPISNIVSMDDPMHRWQRALVSAGFTPKRIRDLEPEIRRITVAVLDDASGRDMVDFVAYVASRVPSEVIGEMLGVAQEDRHLFRIWSDAIGETAGDSSLQVSAFQEMAVYLASMQERRRDVPRDDLVSLLMAAEVDGRKLTQEEQIGFFILLVFAGNETTRNTMSVGIQALGEFPSQRQRLQSDLELIPSFVEEALRWGSTVIHFLRTALVDTEIRGHRIRQGEQVAMFYGAANRDPAVFEDPERFNLTRTPNPHLAFGGGGFHFCLGASLARLELRVMFEEVLQRFPDFEILGPPTWTNSNFVRGITTLPVRLGKDRGHRQ